MQDIFCAVFGVLGMPDRDYYLKNEPEQKRVRTAYVRHIEKLYKLVGASSKEAARTAKVVMDIETRLAQHSMNKEDLRDSQKTYHKKSSRQLAALTPALNWKKYFADTGAGAPASVIVGQPDFFRAVNRMLKETPLERIKIYLEWHVLNSCASLLSKPFVKEQFDFYSRTLAGSKKMKPLWRRGLSALNTVGDELGKLYVAKHFPPKSKQVMDRLVSDLFELYAKRIQRLDWMSAPTKRKALRKLRAMRRKIGYPSKWKNYEGLRIRSDDFFGNMLRASEHEYKRELKKLRGPVDRTEWFMTPQTVNAYFAPNLNEIVFPAAILQWPFFSPAADDAVNYAAIGSVIGHEITHGFDDKGSQFDYKGNLKSWWTPGDRKRFMRKAQIIAKQADAYEVEPGVHLNGQLTLGENIADLGGLAIAYDAYQKHLMKIGRKNIEGLSPEERFFLGFAQYERELSRPEMRKLHALTDHHAEASFRINGPLSNFAPFYETFKVTKKNKLYRAPKNRAEIW